MGLICIIIYTCKRVVLKSMLTVHQSCICPSTKLQWECLVGIIYMEIRAHTNMLCFAKYCVSSDATSIGQSHDHPKDKNLSKILCVSVEGNSQR